MSSQDDPGASTGSPAGDLPAEHLPAEGLPGEGLGSFPPGWTAEQGSWHFLSRLYQRYGIILEFSEYASLVRKLRRGRWRIYKQSPGRAVGVVRRAATGQGLLIVVNLGTGLPVTALPPMRLQRLKSQGAVGIACPVCGRSGLRSADGLAAHMLVKHPEAPRPATAPAPGTHP